ncbi:MAG: hypothetical protein FWB91_07425 [Defluviitaleaceae bacterium]|nr:hypothetical protein [Defluviitaleaceae bacterium]
MDTNNRTHSIDTLLRDALKSTERPDAALVERVKAELAAQSHNKPQAWRSFTRSLTKAAINIAAVLAILTVIVGAWLYLGNFGEPRGFTGNEHATLPGPATYLGSVSTEDGRQVELVAVSVFDDVVDIYVTLTGFSLVNEHFSLWHRIDVVGASQIENVFQPNEIISRTDDSITIRSRRIFSRPVAGMELRHTFWGFAYNIRQHWGHEINLDADEITVQPHMLFFDENPPFFTGGTPEGVEVMLEQMQTTGLPVLQPHLHNIPFDLEGIDAVISSIGIVEGRLHVQVYEPFPHDGDRSSSFSIRTQADEWGFATWWHRGMLDFPINDYLHEFIFIVNFDEIETYTLSGFFHRMDFVDLDRPLISNFMVAEHETVHMAVYPGTIGELGITQIRVNPFFVRLTIETDPAEFIDPTDFITFPEFIMTNPDGTRYTTTSAGFGGLEDIDVRDSYTSLSHGGRIYLFYTIDDAPFQSLHALQNLTMSIEINY